MDAGGGKIAHAEVRIGDAAVMLADEQSQMGHKSPKSYGGTPVSLMLYVADVDAVFKRALAAGATEQRAVEDQFYGDRVGTLVDPFGHVWSIGTHKEDLSHDEIARRVTEAVSEVALLPKEAIWVVFEDVAAEDWYVGAEPVSELKKRAAQK